MPNYCYNKLKIKGEEEKLKAFAEKALTYDTDPQKKNYFDIGNFIPMPKELEDTEVPRNTEDKKLKKKYGADNWYHWALQNWGTKWGTFDSIVHNEDIEYGTLVYEYTTAWCPLIPEVWEKVSKEYPDLTFIIDYEETGMDFEGKMTARNGKVEDFYIE
jgi:hypothetical protein